MSNTIKRVLSWMIVLWASKVFLSSLPYKFTGHPDTQHIFGTIGNWMSGILGRGAGELFTDYGAYVVGTFELTTAIILLLPAVLWGIGKLRHSSPRSYRAAFHSIGGLMASGVMAGAVFFHLFTPLGIEVLHQGESDGGTLFYSALSILGLGMVLFFLNFGMAREARRVETTI